MAHLPNCFVVIFCTFVNYINAPFVGAFSEALEFIWGDDDEDSHLDNRKNFF